MVDWNQFKKITETLWENYEFDQEDVCGLQTGTKWNRGLSVEEIKDLEMLFGMTFPFEYKKMLMIINGFNTGNIDLYDGEGPCAKCYKYPDDWEIVQEFIAELYDNLKYVKITLKELGEKEWAEKEIKGFVPLYGHRALVVFENLELTPVVSAMGNDVIVYGHSLLEYWKNEFELRSNFGYDPMPI